MSQARSPDAVPDRKDNLFEKTVSFIMLSTACFVVLMVGTSAIMRYLFHKDIYGVEELTTIAAFWMYFAGAVYASKEGTHISAEMIGVFTSNKRIIYWTAVVRHVITFLLCAIYAWWGWEFLEWGFVSGGKTNLWQIPLYVGQCSVFFGLACMLVYFGRDCITIFRMTPENFSPNASGGPEKA